MHLTDNNKRQLFVCSSCKIDRGKPYIREHVIHHITQLVGENTLRYGSRKDQLRNSGNFRGKLVVLGPNSASATLRPRWDQGNSFSPQITLVA